MGRRTSDAVTNNIDAADYNAIEMKCEAGSQNKAAKNDQDE